jgi:hypothetical protein
VATEPYVPIAEHTTYDALMTALEVTTDDAETYTSDLDSATDNAESSKNTAEGLLDAKFNLIFLVGA